MDVIGYVDVRIAVVVVIRETNPKAVGRNPILQTRLFGHIGEGAVPVVTVEDIRITFEPARSYQDVSDTHPDQTPLCLQDLFYGVVHIVGHIEIQVAIPVVIHKRRAGAPAVVADSGLVRDVCKTTITPVTVEQVRAGVGHVQVWAAIVVVVAHDGANTPTPVPDSGTGRYILKASISSVAVEHIGSPQGHLPVFDPPAIDHVEIEIAVVVVIEERPSGAAGLLDVVLFQAAAVGHHIQAGLGCHVLKDDLCPHPLPQSSREEHCYRNHTPDVHHYSTLRLVRSSCQSPFPRLKAQNTHQEPFLY